MIYLLFPPIFSIEELWRILWRYIFPLKILSSSSLSHVPKICISAYYMILLRLGPLFSHCATLVSIHPFCFLLFAHFCLFHSHFRAFCFKYFHPVGSSHLLPLFFILMTNEFYFSYPRQTYTPFFPPFSYPFLPFSLLSLFPFSFEKFANDDQLYEKKRLRINYFPCKNDEDQS